MRGQWFMLGFVAGAAMMTTLGVMLVLAAFREIERVMRITPAQILADNKRSQTK